MCSADLHDSDGGRKGGGKAPNLIELPVDGPLVPQGAHDDGVV